MADLEQALQNIEAIFKAEFPVVLPQLEAQYKDGIKLPAPVAYHWEEVPEKIGATPAVMLIPEGEDQREKDQLYDATVRMYVVLTDSEKRHLTRRILRYVKAAKIIIRKPINRTLYQYVTSIKIPAVRYGNTFMDRSQLFARDFSAELVLRIPT